MVSKGRKASTQGEEIEDSRKVVLLADEPSDADEFDAKAHETVATAIGELVLREPGARVIGLEGSWGSGKSTIVRLISKHLHDAESPSGELQMKVVIFDAWAHQGDPLRRTFLESLVEELLAFEWISKSQASEFRAKLAGKRAHMTTTSTQRLTLEGAVTAIAAVLVPSGILMAHKVFGLGLALTLAPLAVVLGFVLAHWVGRILARSGDRASGWPRRLAQLQPFSFFAKEQVTDTTSDQVERSEPTSVEFEQLFSQLLQQAVKDSRRLLIVLDNVDRVEEGDAKTILSTMQTFTGSRSGGGSTWAPRVWTLIPYDPSGLDRLWHPDPVGQEDGGDSVEGEALVRPFTTSTGAAFVDKVFQVRFVAPPLVLSDWRGLLRRLLTHALPQTQNDEIESVLHLRGLYRAFCPEGLVAKEAPTPRQLKQFVNQIGAIRRQGDDVPLVHIAYYVLLRRDRLNITEGLVNGTLPHPKLAHLFRDGLREDLAAVFFGTTQSLAEQLLLRGALDAAFATSDSATVQRLKERSGFLDVLESLDLDPGDGGVELTRAVAVLSGAGVLDDPAVEGWSKRALHPGAWTALTWLLDGKETGIGLAWLFDRMTPGDDNGLSKLLGRIAAGTRDTDTDGQVQLAGAAALCDELVRLGRVRDSVRVRIDIPVERLAPSLAFFEEKIERHESAGILEITAGRAQVVDSLIGAATSEGFTVVKSAIDVLHTGRPEFVDFNALGSGCLTWLFDHEPSTEEHLAVLLELIDRARQEDSLADALGGAADNGTLMRLLAVASRNGWPNEAAAASMLHLDMRPAFAAVQSTRESPVGMQRLRQALTNPPSEPQLISSQLEWLRAHHDEAFGLLMRIAKTGSFQAWVDTHVTALCEASALTTSADEYLSNWQYLQRVLGAEAFTRYTRGLLDKSTVRKGIIAKCDDPAVAQAALEATSLGTEAAYMGRVRSWASRILKQTTIDRWRAALQQPSGDPLIQVALEVAGTDAASVDPPGLEEAVRTHYQALANGVADWQPDFPTFAKVMTLLSPSTRGVIASEICAYLEGRVGHIPSGFFSIYADFLAGEKEFRTHKKLPNVVERLVAEEDWKAVGWFVELGEESRDTFQKKQRKAEVEHLSRKVGEKLTDASGDSQAVLSRLNALLRTYKTDRK